MRRISIMAVMLAAWATHAHAQNPPADIDKIVIAGGADVTGLNALDLIVIVPDRSLMDHISDNLLRWEAPGKLGPWLATSWTLVDPTTWQLSLRKGVKFQNGEDFNAESVKFFFDTMNDPKVIAPAKTNYTFVKEVKILDDYTVQIITKAPYPVTPNQLALAHMIPPKYAREVGLDGYRRKPIGTGAYRLVEHVKDDHLTLEAFDGFWGGKQKIKTIIYRPIKEDAARAAAVLTGEADVGLEIPPELAPMFAGNPKVTTKTILTGRTYIAFLNALDPKAPTANRDVREAINIAIDRDSLNKNILLGTGAPAAWLSPKTFGFNPDIKPLAYDPERAKALLAKAGYPNGIDVAFDAPDGKYAKDKELAQAMAGQMAKAGIRATVRTNDWALLTKRIFNHQVNDITMIGWGDSNGDPESHNRLALQSGSTWSTTKDPHLDDLFARMSREMDPEKRKALMFEQQAYLRESFPMLYVAQMGLTVGLSQRLAWFEPRTDERYYFFTANGVK